MPVKPVWWMDDERALSMDEKKRDKIIDLTSSYNKAEQKALKKLKDQIEDVL